MEAGSDHEDITNWPSVWFGKNASIVLTGGSQGVVHRLNRFAAALTWAGGAFYGRGQQNENNHACCFALHPSVLCPGSEWS